MTVLALLTALLQPAFTIEPAGVSLLATIVVPADARDRSGLPGTPGGELPHDRLGAFGSGIAWTGRGHRYVVLPDRGPKDGGTAYRCRFHLVTIGPASESEPDWAFTVDRTVLLSDEEGRPFIGASGAYSPSGPADGSADLRLDPEGVRVGADGTVYISDEYGPHVLAFSPEGRLLRRLPVPERFRPAVRDGLEEGELPPTNAKGREPNRGFEGLAMSADGGTLFTILQSPLLQDSALDEANEHIGRFIRVLTVPVQPGPAPVRQAEWVYRLTSPQFAVNEMLAVNDHVFLTIERDGREGEKARFKRIMKVDFADAPDVSTVEELPPLELPLSITAGKSTTLINLLDPALGLNTAEAPIPNKIEGLCFGPDQPDGRRTLLVTTDNDFKPTEPTRIWVFAVDRAALR